MNSRNTAKSGRRTIECKAQSRCVAAALFVIINAGVHKVRLYDNSQFSASAMLSKTRNALPFALS